jgi:hypothetical protein
LLGPIREDGATVKAWEDRRSVDYTQFLDPNALRGARIGLLRSNSKCIDAWIHMGRGR